MNQEFRDKIMFSSIMLLATACGVVALFLLADRVVSSRSQYRCWDGSAPGRFPSPVESAKPSPNVKVGKDYVIVD